MDKELQGIKERVNTSYFYQDNPPEAHGDVLYLLNRLEAAEEFARDVVGKNIEEFRLGRLSVYDGIIENMELYINELKHSRDSIKKGE